MNFRNPAWRARPLHTSLRVLKSVLRRTLPLLSQPSVPYDDGQSRVIADLRTALGRSLYRYGHSDPDLDLVKKLVAPGDVFIDGGANVGLFTLVAASRVGRGGQVFSFEPSSATRQALTNNVALNGFDWVKIRREGLDEGSGTRSFAALKGDSAGLASFQTSDRKVEEADLESVPTIALDDAIPAADWPRIALIKLDLEGAEYSALLGAKAILRDVAPDFLIEIDSGHLLRQGASADLVLDLFRAAGYEFLRPRREERGLLSLVRESNPVVSGGAPNLFVTRDVARAIRAGISVL